MKSLFLSCFFLLCTQSAFALISEGRPGIPYFNKMLYLQTKIMEGDEVSWISLAFEDPDQAGAVCNNVLDVFEGKELFHDVPEGTWVLLDYELQSVLVEEGFTGDADVVRVTPCKSAQACHDLMEERQNDPEELAYRQKRQEAASSGTTRRVDAEVIARELDTGRMLVKSMRCRGCHKIEGFGAEHAPSLSWKRQKYEPGWLRRYLARPYKMRPAMDELMMLKYNSPNAQPNMTQEELDFLVGYLTQSAWTRLTPLDQFRREPWQRYECYECHTRLYRENPLIYEPTEIPQEFSEEIEKSAALKVCIGCHAFGDFSTSSGGKPPLAPDLVFVAEKLQIDYLIDYLRDPGYLQPGSKMPKLPLSEEQLAKIRAFFEALKAEIASGTINPIRQYYRMDPAASEKSH